MPWYAALSASGFVGEQLTRRGIVADVALHTVRAKDGGDNPHAHILFSSRPVLKNGSGFGKKNRLLERQETLKQWRTAWGEHVNRALAEAEAGARIDHRTLAEQGIGRQAEILSLAAFHMEARGGRTRQGDRCREVRMDNVRRELSRSAVIEAVREDMAEQMSAAQHRTQELLALAHLAAGHGGIALVATPEEAARWESYLRKTRRGEVIRLSRHRFNPLNWAHRAGAPSETIATLLIAGLRGGRASGRPGRGRNGHRQRGFFPRRHGIAGARRHRAAPAVAARAAPL